MKNKLTVGFNITFVTLLTGVFFALKITGYVDWSWNWVISPLYAYAAFYGLLFAIVGGYTVFKMIEKEETPDRTESPTKSKFLKKLEEVIKENQRLRDT
jgi:acyl-coenzyme A synthetase/AMP-(fatty) acid ligase